MAKESKIDRITNIASVNLYIITRTLVIIYNFTPRIKNK